MNNNIDHIDDLIGRYLAKEALAEEKSFVEHWIRESDTNQKYFDQLKFIFDRAVMVKEVPEFNTDVAWNKLKTKLQQDQNKTIAFNPEPPSTTKRITLNWWRIAATILIILGVGFYFYQSSDSSTLAPIQIVAEKTTEADTLPDGSTVFLNKQTTLAYTFDKKKQTHIVKLKGEAHFNIHHEDEKDFLVDVSGVYIEDIGTVFNVKAYPEENTIEVVVEEGEVRLYTEGNSGVYLKAGGKGVYNKITKQFSVVMPEPNVTAYKTKLFSFSNTDLATVTQTLNQVYDKKIIIDDKLHKCKLTVTFADEKIEKIATIIAETLGLTMQSSATEIVLEGEGCE